MTYALIRAMFMPKEGSSEAEWEDAAGFSEHMGRAALADGASSSYRASAWSAALVDAFLSAPPDLQQGPAPFENWVTATAAAFQANSEAVSDTSWYAADASRRGSFATFSAVQLTAGPQPAFRAVSVGDACLFHVRDDALVRSIPGDLSAFGSTPELLSSVAYQGSHGTTTATFSSGELSVGDTLLLTSDALGASMLRLHELGQPVWWFFRNVGSTGFVAAVTALRSQCLMENDDVTMVRLRVLEADR